MCATVCPTAALNTKQHTQGSRVRGERVGADLHVQEHVLVCMFGPKGVRAGGAFYEFKGMHMCVCVCKLVCVYVVGGIYGSVCV